MKRSMFILLAAMLVISIMLVVGCSKNPVDPLTNEQSKHTSQSESTVLLNFDHPMTMVEVGQFVKTNNLEALEVRLNRPDYVVGFQLEGRDPAAAVDEFTQEHQKFLQFLSSRPDKESSAERSAAQAELFGLNSQDLCVTSIMITGNASEASQLPNVTVVDQQSANESPNLPTDEKALKRTPESTSLYHQSWAPYGGTSEVKKSYSYQRFIFNDLSKLGSGMATYEHETHIWDKNYANQTGYWASNMPNAYLDCGNFDSVDNFAVGTFTANQLRTYTWYYAYIGLTGQSSPSSMVSIWAQRGTRWAWSCWSVTSNEHAGPLTTHAAGGGISWQF